MVKIPRKIFSFFVSLLILTSQPKVKTRAIDPITIGVGYAIANIGTRALTKIGLFIGAFQSVNPEINRTMKEYYDSINVEYEEIREDVDGKSVVIGRKYWCNRALDHSLENINVIFFSGNGGSVLNDEFHLGVNGKLIYLMQKGATVYAIDYRGFGNRKFWLGPFSMSEETIFADGERTFQYVFDRSKNKRIVLFGYSMGGQILMHVWRYTQEKAVESKLAGVILHSPLNNFNKVAGKIFRPLEWLLNVMFINISSFKELKNIKPTSVPSYWYSGYTEGISEFVDMITTVCGLPYIDMQPSEAAQKVKQTLEDMGIMNAHVVMNKASHLANHNFEKTTYEGLDNHNFKTPTTDGEIDEMDEYKKVVDVMADFARS